MDNDCPAASNINAGGQWASLTPEALQVAKSAYAAKVAADVLVQAQTLVSAWTGPADGSAAGFTTGFSAAGDANAFGSEQSALDALYGAMWYLHEFTRGMKLGQPLGRNGQNPVALYESAYAKRTLANIRQNVLGFKRLFIGCAAGGGMGFDDLLRAINAGDTADKMITQLGVITTLLDRLQAAVPDLPTALAGARGDADALYDAIDGLMDLARDEMAGRLNLKQPMSAEGDNDS